MIDASYPALNGSQRFQRGIEFVEYDVEKDAEARERMLKPTGGNRTVPVIVEEDKSPQIGWMGRCCVV